MKDESQTQLRLRVREALEALLRANEETRGKEVGEIFLGPDMFVATLQQPQGHILEGEWEDTNRTMDLLELIDRYQNSSSSPSLRAPGRAGD